MSFNVALQLENIVIKVLVREVQLINKLIPLRIPFMTLIRYCWESVCMQSN